MLENLYGGIDMTQVMFGDIARRAPAWVYVQHQGPDVVSFIGSSRIPGVGDAHPLRYGSDRTHQFLLGEVMLRPTRFALGTDALRGSGLSALATGGHDLRAMLHQGEPVIGAELLEEVARRQS